jgi:hypothetical protein
MSEHPDRRRPRAYNTYQDRAAIVVYFERAERDGLREYAKKNCMNVSNFMRRLALHYMETHSGPRARKPAEEP